MQERIETDLIAAMKSGDNLKRETLRLLKSALKNAQIEKGSALTDEEAVTVIQREVKRRKEAVESYKSAGREDQAAQEEQESVILEAYLPEQMNEEDLRSYVTDYLSKNPTGMADIGRAMGALSGQLKGKADMGLVSRLLRELVTPSGQA